MTKWLTLLLAQFFLSMLILSPCNNPPATVHKVTVSWDGSAAATYNVYRSVNSGGPYAIVGKMVRDVSFTDEHVTLDTDYFYIVKTVDPKTGVESTPSKEIKIHVPKK